MHYGADELKYPAYNEVVWRASSKLPIDGAELASAPIVNGSNPISVSSSTTPSNTLRFIIVEPKNADSPQPGDGTVPACSGEAPNLQGSSAVQQSFRMNGYEHQSSYDNEDVRWTTLWCIGKMLTGAKRLT